MPEPIKIEELSVLSEDHKILKLEWNHGSFRLLEMK